MGRVGRWLLVLVSLLLIAGFGLALALEPDPRGFGTHQRLGLPPCTFMAIFNLPCPSCGMTTSFANFTRGRFIAAADANVAGLVLASVCFVLIPWCLMSAWSGRLWRVSRPDRAALSVLITICGVSLLQWIVRITFG